MISTVSMIGIGKVYENLMVDDRQTNRKLVTDLQTENDLLKKVTRIQKDK